MKQLLTITMIFFIGCSSEKHLTADIPREPMPDHVYQTLSQQLSMALENDADTQRQTQNKEGFEEFRAKVNFPVFKELEFLQLHHHTDESIFMYRWGKRIDTDRVLIILDDFTEKELPTKQFSKINKANINTILKKINEANGGENGILSESDIMPVLKNDREWVLWNKINAREIREDFRLFYYAYLAAYFNDSGSADILLKSLLAMRRPFFADLYNRAASDGIQGGKSMLMTQHSFGDVYNHWQSTSKVYPSEELTQLLEEIKPQIDAETATNRETQTDVENLSLEEKIEFYIDQLQETQEYAIMHPPHYSLLRQCQPLIDIGMPAIPALIEHLDDNRLTRTVHEDHFSSRRIYRVRDVVLACIKEILGYYPNVPKPPIQIGSSQDLEKYYKVMKEEMTQWWEVMKDKSQLQQWIAQLDESPISVRLDLLSKIEQADPNAVDSIALLKQWAEESDIESVEEKIENERKKMEENTDVSSLIKGVHLGGLRLNLSGDLPAIATALAKRGDFSLRTKMRKEFEKSLEKKFYDIYNYPYAWYLCEYGDADDFSFMFQAVKQEMQEGFQPGSSRIVGPVFSGVRSSTQALTVPILIHFLDCDLNHGSGSNWYGDGSFSYADIAMQILIERIGHHEGFQTTQPPTDRKQAIQKWKAWWNLEGEELYAQDHPEISEMIEE